MKITDERKKELIAFSEEAFLDQLNFDYHSFDGYIEEGELTSDELEWLRDNTEISVTVEEA